DDVLDDHDVTSLDALGYVLEQANLSARSIAVPVTRDGKKIHADLARATFEPRKRARQVGGEEQGALEHADEQDRFPCGHGGQLASHTVDRGGNLGFGKDDRFDCVV